MYYNHNSFAGWYVDGALQVSRLSGDYGQAGMYSLDGASSRTARVESAEANTTAIAVQGEFGYRLAFSSGTSLTPKLRLDHHRIRFGTASGTPQLGTTQYSGLSKTGIYYGVRWAKDWMTTRGRIRIWAEPGVAHTVGARAGYKHVAYFEQAGLTGRRNLNATRIGLGLGIEGRITQRQNLRVEGGINREIGNSNSRGTGVMVSWNLAF